MLIPKNRHEYYLAVISGNDYPTFPPKIREEQYLAKLAGREVDVPIPKAPKERAYYNIINDIKFEPENRWQTFVAAANDDSITVPAPITREEIWWSNISLSHEVIVEYVGTLPATLTGTKAGYLESYKIYGNTVQNGTPTSENPIAPSGCGERTENLFDLSSYYEVSSSISDIIIEKNRITYNAPRQYLAIKYKFNLGIADVYTISLGADSLNTRLELRYGKNGEYVGRAIAVSPNQKTTVRGGNEYDRFYVYISNFTNTGICTASNIMLNLGSTALPYEPYGYKLPLTANGVEYPIYLGESQTTRKIKKLVLTGEEGWRQFSDGNIYITLSPNKSVAWTRVSSTHFTPSQMQTNGGLLWFNYNKVDFDTVDECKQYLAAQYANGTPVTVWYVLDKPETAVVNEPLMKIGDYADTIDSAQTTVQIPTAAGTTVIDYNGALKPDKVELTYKTIRKSYISSDDKVYQDPNGQLLGG